MRHSLPERWTVFRLSALGDLVLATGPLAWWNARRGLRFTVVTRDRLAPVLAGHPAVDEVIGLDETRLTGEPWPAVARELAARCRDTGLLDLHGTLRSRVLGAVWSGPVRRYPKFSLSRRLFQRTRLGFLRRRLEALNVPQRYTLALEAEAPHPGELLPLIRLTAEERETGRELAARAGVGPGFLALHPYATHPDKAWPREHWLELTRRLDAEGLPWAVVGRDAVPLLPDDPRDLTNATDLRALCALLAQAGALATNDSGPMHLASAVGTPVLALFGPTARAWGFFPAGPRDRVLERDLPCRPCSLHGGTPCATGRACLASIGPEEVLDAARGVLGGEPG
ncbi:glycosyltransferase family 9 protein [Desulfovibrio aminophilus]|nr:glycosyltransferase family 9 protein [Desulfovibrio aminophilus]MCM0756747.1 glycosyltransferase family 9 protein [Desulfovibrio aminophilus]